MISIQGKNHLQVQRSIAHLFEPYIVKTLQVKHHTFFIYRCSEYHSFEFFLKKENYSIRNDNSKEILSTYWSAIDILHIKIKNQPIFEPTQTYFNKLREIYLKEKEIKDFECYEVKLTGKKKTVISVRTQELHQKLEAIKKSFQLVEIKISGHLNISSNIIPFEKGKFIVKTHYGRKGYTLRTTV